MNSAKVNCLQEREAIKQIDLEPKSNKHKVAAGFDKAADNYDNYALVQQQIAAQALELFKSNTPELVTEIVDIGCGTAQSFSVLSALCERFIGLDLSLNMLKQAQNKANYSKQCTCLNADAEDLPIANSAVASVYSSMALQWSKQPQTALNEIHRVLSTGGTATLAILVDDSFKALRQAWQSLGMVSRVNQLHSAKTWLLSAERLNWKVQWQQQTFYSAHKSALDLLNSIKMIGANTRTQIDNDHFSSLSAHHPISKKELAALSAFSKAQNTNDQGLVANTTASVPTVPSKCSQELLYLDYHLLFLTLKK